uniref:Uncharacterized protein n=1 Tax=Panagrolaimus superbus TaxID=310955 RepID=A0A914YIQ7_9BILA
MTMAGRIAIMNRGKFVQIGEPEEIYEHPTTRYSAEFIGSVNVFEGVLKEPANEAWAQTGHCVAIYLVDLAVSAAISDCL